MPVAATHASAAIPTGCSLVTTPNHPEYPAGHGCLSGASTRTLKRFFATDSFHFTIDSTVAGVTAPVRSNTRASRRRSTEVIDARVYGGMHYRFSVENGAEIAKKASRLAARAFRPRHGHDDDDHDHCDGDDDDEGHGHRHR